MGWKNGLHIPIVFLIAASFVILGCSGVSRQSDKIAHIHSIRELNKEAEPLDSHAGEEASSVLELDYNAYIEVPGSRLGIERPIYPRIKKTKSGDYLLFYHNNQVGAHIYYSRSSDLKTWSKGEYLFRMRPFASARDENDTLRFSTADAVVLSNGDIIVVVSFRANRAYISNPETNGLMIRRSTDNGLTWGEEQIIYVGTNWEPYLLQLPSGRIQCYFTDSTVFPDNRENSGTVSMVVSDDMGETWHPTGISNAYKVSRQYKYDYKGRRVYTDQMPSARVLNNGSLAVIMEAYYGEEFPLNVWHHRRVMVSLAYAEQDYAVLTGDEAGPEDRQTNLFQGAGPYMAQFPSGETVISSNIQYAFSMKIGDSTARKFNGDSWDTSWYIPFHTSGFWGSLEVIDTHEIIGTIHGAGSIVIGRFILNHRINAPAVKITVDGDNEEWSHTDALFIGSASPKQTVFRAAKDADNFYILAEQLDKRVSAGDNMELYFHNDGTPELNDHSLRITIGSKGLVECAKWSGKSWTVAEIPGLQVAGGMYKGRGCLFEVGIPLSVLDAAGPYFRFNAVTVKKDARDSFTFAMPNDPATWMLIKGGNND